MEYYNILAWMPGEPIFIAKNANGEIGILNKSFFHPCRVDYRSACHKFGYKNLSNLDICIPQEAVEKLAESLS